MKPKNFHIKVNQYEQALTIADIDALQQYNGLGLTFVALLNATNLWHKLFSVAAYKRIPREKTLRLTAPYIRAQVVTFIRSENLHMSQTLVDLLHEKLGPSTFKMTYQYDRILDAYNVLVQEEVIFPSGYCYCD